MLAVGAEPVSLAGPARQDAYEGVHQRGDEPLRGVLGLQVQMVVFCVACHEGGAEVGADVADHVYPEDGNHLPRR